MYLGFYKADTKYCALIDNANHITRASSIVLDKKIPVEDTVILECRSSNYIEVVITFSVLGHTIGNVNNRIVTNRNRFSPAGPRLS